MFEQMRKNTKTILWITVIAFIGLIFLAWGADFQIGGQGQNLNPNQIGAVNGEPISSQSYEIALANARAQYQGPDRQELDERTEAMIRNQTWNQLIQETILLQEARRRGIEVSNEEIVQAVMSQPPPEVAQSPQFMTNGQFDITKWQAMLRHPNFDTRPLEALVRAQLPLQKLQMQVAGTIAVSDAELWETFQAQSEKIKVEYAMVPASRFTVDESAINDGVIEQYFQQHASRYRSPEEAVLQYVNIPVAHTVSDSLNMVELAAQCVQEVRDGVPFNELVDAFSDAPLHLRGGADGSFLTAEQLEPGVRDAAFSLQPGEVSGIITVPRGMHVIKVLERRADPAGDQVKIADIYIPLKPSPETLSDVRDRVIQFRQEVTERGFAEVAGEMTLAVRETPAFTEAGFIPGLGVVPELTDLAFGREAGTISTVIERPDGYVVARLKERRPARVPDLAEVRERVRTEVADSLRGEQARQVAEGLLSRAQSGTPISALASGDDRVVADVAEPFSRLGSGRGIGNDPAVLGPLFAAEPGTVIPKVLVGRSGAIVARVFEKIPADRAQFDQQKTQLRQSLIQRKQGQLFNDWLTDLRRQAEIHDYRFGLL